MNCYGFFTFNHLTRSLIDLWAEIDQLRIFFWRKNDATVKFFNLKFHPFYGKLL